MIDAYALFSAMPSAVIVFDAQSAVAWKNPAAEAAFASSIDPNDRLSLITQNAELQRAVQICRDQDRRLKIVELVLDTNWQSPKYRVDVFTFAADGSVATMFHSLDDQAEIFDQQERAKGAVQSAVGLSAMLCHEIKNPLAGISGAAQLLSANLDTADQELTELIVDETRRISTLLDQVEEIGDVSTAPFVPTNIHTIIDRAITSAELGFAQHITFERLYDPSLPDVVARSDALVQVFLNLIKNAAEAQAGAGHITLRTFYDTSVRLDAGDGQTVPVPVQIEVIDQGPGLPPNLESRIFDPFVSGKQNGTGLGLALSSKILAEHRGTIFVKSKPGHTVFRVSLPTTLAEQG